MLMYSLQEAIAQAVADIRASRTCYCGHKRGHVFTKEEVKGNPTRKLGSAMIDFDIHALPVPASPFQAPMRQKADYLGLAGCQGLDLPSQSSSPQPTPEWEQQVVLQQQAASGHYVMDGIDTLGAADWLPVGPGAFPSKCSCPLPAPAAADAVHRARTAAANSSWPPGSPWASSPEAGLVAGATSSSHTSTPHGSPCSTRHRSGSASSSPVVFSQGASGSGSYYHHHQLLSHVHSRLDLHLQQQAARHAAAAGQQAAASARPCNISTAKAVLADLTNSSSVMAAPTGGFADASLLAALLRRIQEDGQQLAAAAVGPQLEGDSSVAARRASDGGAAWSSSSSSLSVSDAALSDGGAVCSTSGRRGSSEAGPAHPGCYKRLLDCIDTVTFLAHDASNCSVLDTLGAVPTLCGLLQRLAPCGVPGGQQVEPTAALLRCLAALAKHCEAVKPKFWSSRGGDVTLQLLGARHVSAAVLAAHAAVDVLAWAALTGDSSNSNSVGSRRSRRRAVLLEPRLLQALASVLHPNTPPQLLRLALQQLHKAAAVKGAGTGAGWRGAAFALVPLLVATPGRRWSAGDAPVRQSPPVEVQRQVLEVLLVLVEREDMHDLLAAAGCLPPLLTLLVDKTSGRLGALAGCVLTSVVDAPACQKRLQEEAVLVALLKVLQQHDTFRDEALLAAAHLLRRLVQGSDHSAHHPQQQQQLQQHMVALLQAHGALPLLYRLLLADLDPDVRHVLVSLLAKLGGEVTHRSRRHAADPGCAAPAAKQVQRCPSPLANSAA